MLCFHQLRLLAALVELLACLSFQDLCSRHWCIALDDNDNGDDGDEEEDDNEQCVNDSVIALADSLKAVLAAFVSFIPRASLPNHDVFAI